MNRHSKRETLSLSHTEWQHPWSLTSPPSHNSLILDYFYYEGLYAMHHTFASETNMVPKNDKLFKDRAELRICLERGSVDEAIQRINDINSEILDNNVEMYYSLMQHKAAEYINECHLSGNNKGGCSVRLDVGVSLVSDKDAELECVNDKCCEIKGVNDTGTERGVSNSTITTDAINIVSGNVENNLHFKDELIERTLQFIQNDLAPVVENNSNLVSSLEDLMEYFVFGEGDNIERRRRRVGGYINGVLMSIYDGNSSELKEVLRGIVAGENKLSRKYKFPSFRSYNS